MLTQTQKKTAESIINIFETNEVLGNYGQLTVIPGDTGHLTFGRSQTTLVENGDRLNFRHGRKTGENTERDEENTRNHCLTCEGEINGREDS